MGFVLQGVELIIFITYRSEEHTSELQSQSNLVCRLLLEKKKNHNNHLRRHQHREWSRLHWFESTLALPDYFSTARLDGADTPDRQFYGLACRTRIPHTQV